jgi:hypothetical protein
MRDLDLTTLRLFVTVCETRNMARAAEQAHIVGSAISKRLAQLEETVGTPLLVRRRHGVEPTPAGETLLEHTRTMLASADRIEQDMAAYVSGVRGQVRLLATASVMAESLADDVAAFLKNPAHATSAWTWKSASAPRWCGVSGKAARRWASAGPATRVPTRARCSRAPTAATTSPSWCIRLMRWPRRRSRPF